MAHKDIYSKETGKLLEPAPVELPAPRLPRPPFWMIAIGLLGIVFSWVPLVASALLRADKKTEPRVSFIQDMGVQPKLREQQTNPVFADGRAMRPAVVGTVNYDNMEQDDFYYRGFHTVHNAATNKDDVVYYRGFPSQVRVDRALLLRGQDRFNIYCSACHGMDGAGHGAVNDRVMQLQADGMAGMKWTQAASLQDPQIKTREEGNLFNTITNGVRNMPGYRSQIPDEKDRWAIIAYVKALQLSQDAPASALTAGELEDLNSK